MSNRLQLALYQHSIIWESPKDNLAILEQNMANLKEGVDIVILPEMFSSGFTMNPQRVSAANAEEVKQGIIEISQKHDLAICGSLAIKEGESYFNRFFWVESGKWKNTYDKRHLFRMAKENDVYAPGKQDVRMSFKGWNIMPRVCYDLRFPVWSRSNTVDLQIYVANWPQVRVSAWDTLLKARAIENQCYVVGVNRVGIDGNEIPYSGHSIVIDPKGQPITEIDNEEEGWIYSETALEPLQAYREKFPVALDADHFTIPE